MPSPPPTKDIDESTIEQLPLIATTTIPAGAAAELKVTAAIQNAVDSISSAAAALNPLPTHDEWAAFWASAPPEIPEYFVTDLSLKYRRIDNPQVDWTKFAGFKYNEANSNAARLWSYRDERDCLFEQVSTFMISCKLIYGAYGSVSTGLAENHGPGGDDLARFEKGLPCAIRRLDGNNQNHRKSFKYV